MVAVISWSIKTTHSIYTDRHEKQKEKLQAADETRLSYSDLGITNWEALASAMANKKWCAAVADQYEKNAIQLQEERVKEIQLQAQQRRELERAKQEWEQASRSYSDFETLRNAKERVEEAESALRPPRGLDFSSFSDPESLLDSAQAMRNRNHCEAIRTEALAKISAMKHALAQASRSIFLSLYLYWLIIPLLVGVLPGIVLIGAKSQYVHSYFARYGSARYAIIGGAVTLLLLTTFATPRIYNIYSGSFDSKITGKIINIAPFFYYKPQAEDGYELYFDGLNISVLLVYVFIAIAFGCLIWALGGISIRNSNHSSSLISPPPTSTLKDKTPSSLSPATNTSPIFDDEPLDKQAKEFESSPMFKMGFMAPLPDYTQVPNAVGPFGECLTNPIPVNGHLGTFTYLSRLRSKSGVGFMWHRLGMEETPTYPKPVDVYELAAIDASEWRTLYFGIYHRHRSTLVPSGLTLLSWSQMSEIERVMAKTGVPGHNQKIENFPFGLPNVIVQNKVLSQISPDLGKTMAKTVQKWIDESKGKWGTAYRQSKG